MKHKTLFLACAVGLSTVFTACRIPAPESTPAAVKEIAELKLSTLFTDGAVLQRDMVIPVWGKTAPYSRITAFLAGKQAFARANDAGDFMLRFPALPAGGPYELTVMDFSTGKKQVVKDILIGEVWLTSGQSNMEYMMNRPDELNFTKKKITQMEEFNQLVKKNPGMIRVFKAPVSYERYDLTSGAANVKSTWKYATPGNVKTLSAVSLWFAYEVQKNLGVPVGILCSAVGGTDIQAWTSRNAMMRHEKDRDQMEYFERMVNNPGQWDTGNPSPSAGKYLPAVRELMKKNGLLNSTKTKLAEGWAKENFDDSAWQTFKVPGGWGKLIGGNGTVWVRREVQIPEEWKGHDLVLNLGPVCKQDVAFFNNTEVGHHYGQEFSVVDWGVLRKYPVPASLVKTGRNVIAVRASALALGGGFNGSGAQYTLSCPALNASIPLAGDWKAAAECDLGPAGYKGYYAPALGNFNSPAMLFNTMIHPLIPYAIRGALWYQGENNAGSHAEAQDYERRMKLLIADWRQQWEQGEFPFYMVQLAPFGRPVPYHDGGWAHLRESQRKSAETTPNTGMAVIMDAGAPADIHPVDKKTVGERLARLALHHTYGKKNIVPNGPMFERVTKENGGRFRIHFRNGEELRTVDGKEVKGFMIAGADRKFQSAKAVIDGKTVLVSADIKDASCIRYGWAQSPDVNLVNGAGIPASPFEAELGK